MIVGGWSREKQTFSRTAANAQSAMLTLALAALVFPALFQLIHGGRLPPVGAEHLEFGSDVEHLSLGVALVLLVSYAAGLWFSLKTHRDVFNPYHETSRRRSTILAGAGGRRIYLALAAVAVGVMSEILVGSITEASENIGLSEFFVGVFIVAIVGNAAEHWVAVLVAAKDKMDLAVNIAIGSSAQIALFVAPVLVLLSFVVGDDPMALVFNGYELGRAAVRRADRQPRDPGRRVELVRGRAAAVAVRRAGAGLLLRLRRAADRSLRARSPWPAPSGAARRGSRRRACRRRGGSRGRAGGRRGRARSSRCRGR